MRFRNVGAGNEVARKMLHDILGRDLVGFCLFLAELSEHIGFVAALFIDDRVVALDFFFRDLFAC